MKAFICFITIKTNKVLPVSYSPCDIQILTLKKITLYKNSTHCVVLYTHEISLALIVLETKWILRKFIVLLTRMLSFEDNVPAVTLYLLPSPPYLSGCFQVPQVSLIASHKEHGLQVPPEQN